MAFGTPAVVVDFREDRVFATYVVQMAKTIERITKATTDMRPAKEILDECNHMVRMTTMLSRHVSEHLLVPPNVLITPEPPLDRA